MRTGEVMLLENVDVLCEVEHVEDVGCEPDSLDLTEVVEALTASEPYVGELTIAAKGTDDLRELVVDRV